MADKQLFEYIKQQLQLGINKEQIKNSLLSVGWQAQDIDESFNSSSTPPSQPITQNNIAPQSASRLSRSLKILLGIASFWPIFYIGTFITISILSIITMFSIRQGSLITPQLFNLLYMFYFPTIILVFILSFIYVMFAYKNELISKNEKNWWIVVFFLGILLPIYIGTSTLNKNDFNLNIVFYAGLFVVITCIAIPDYWYNHICKEREQNQLPKSRFPYIYVPILYFVAFLVVPVILVGNEIFVGIQAAKVYKKGDLERFENAKKVKAYLPTTLSNEWSLANKHIDSGGDVVQVEYFQVDSGRKHIIMAEIVSPKTELKCDRDAYSEFNRIIPYELSSEEMWLKRCEGISVGGKKAILSENEQRIKPNSIFINEKEFSMIYDKEDTRIFLYYEQMLQDYLMGTKENWSKNDLIRAAENLRPIDKKDFGL